MQLKYRLATAASTAALMMQMLAPAALADVDITISDNAQNSTNNAVVVQTNNVNVTQNNTDNITLNINSTASTGNNNASGNNGGNVTINTGSANSTVDVTVSGNSNNATVVPCPCNTTANVTISDNGQDSINDATSIKTNNTTVSQKNKRHLNGSIRSRARTGRNTASGNNNGTVNVTTGNTNSTVNVTVNGSSNNLP